ncbi:MAG TPA: peptide deformylase [Candidatus Limnocylindria bacterium]|nr:peptide deformylase [Candidatus Limnocylindria bacterium]
MILPILTYPDPLLRKPTEPVSFPLSKEMVKLTKDMIDTVKQADGIGLAAPQVGKSVKLIIINLEKSGVPLIALYNPKVVSKGFKKIEIEEGCLSIPGVFGMVKRPKKVTVQAQNAEGKLIKFSDDGWISRVSQHEIDHINGKLIIDLIKKYTQGEDTVKQWKKEKLI